MNSYITYGQANDRLDRKTVLLAASSLFIFGAFLGCAVYRILGIGESELYDNLIERYFLALFYKCDTSLDVMRVALDCIFHELWLFIAVFPKRQRRSLPACSTSVSLRAVPSTAFSP